MSILNSNQRAFIRADTGIDRLLIDRVVEAYDELLDDNVHGYRTKMFTALVLQGIPKIKPEDRPTAVDKVKTICIKRIADERHWTFQRTAQYLQEAAEK